MFPMVRQRREEIMVSVAKLYLQTQRDALAFAAAKIGWNPLLLEN